MSETTARIMREAIVTKSSENGEAALYAAEAGFNRVRARLTKNGADRVMQALDGRAETISDETGVPDGQYSLSVVKIGDQPYAVVSIGTAGSGGAAGKRVIAGTIWVSGTVLGCSSEVVMEIEVDIDDNRTGHVCPQHGIPYVVVDSLPAVVQLLPDYLMSAEGKQRLQLLAFVWSQSFGGIMEAHAETKKPEVD